ncbi:hypothetical protein GIB67_039127 [Kingdonia uniflora]|uniref:Protein kinase domain-containing protein n=1 Tax=Kingdonia uniflora TaxID=39325 RepID=A0A7J7MLN8_9MAGN|nr:hypothetical protein GIB67_039127 [Kingdonia uniflora]
MPSGFLPVNIQLFSYHELRSATDNFSAHNKIGRGGFGTVYKGILRDGKQVAVKVLSAESKQGVHEFLTEIDMLSNVKHPNLVELIGCCVQESNRIILYEYVENSSLDRVLLGTKDRAIKLDWGVRSAICTGTARGLVFLHEGLEPYIVHRDIKASNILLANDFIPKIGDFGLAKIFPDNITHISTRVVGTTGYLAPEYAMHGQLTKKADVYSFGVLMLEIISGRSNSQAIWGGTQKTWKLYEEGKLLELVDPELEEYPRDEVIRYIKVALFCTQAASLRRPSVTQAFSMLSRDIRLNEQELTPPGFYFSIASTGTPPISNKNSASSDSISKPVSFSHFTMTQVAPR